MPGGGSRGTNLVEVILLCEKTGIYIFIYLFIYYVYTQQYSTIVSNYNLLFSAWRHVSAAHTAIFRLEDGCMRAETCRHALNNKL